MRAEVSDIKDHRQGIRVRLVYQRIENAVSIARKKSLGLSELTLAGVSSTLEQNDHSRVDQDIDVGKRSTGRRIDNRNVSFDRGSDWEHRL